MRGPEKSVLRKQFRHARAQVSADEHNTAAETISRLLEPHTKKGRRIGMYWPTGRELRLDGFVYAAQKRGTKLYLPYVEPHTWRMQFTPYPVDGARQERKRGRAKLHAPQLTGKEVYIHQFSLLLVPIVGTDKRGYHFGQAGSYYDTTLSAMKYRLQTRTLGVGLGYQLTGILPTEPHGIPLSNFVSGLGVLKFRRHQ